MNQLSSKFKFYLLCVVFSLAIGLSACGGGDKKTDTPATESAPAVDTSLRTLSPDSTMTDSTGDGKVEGRKAR